VPKLKQLQNILVETLEMPDRSVKERLRILQLQRKIPNAGPGRAPNISVIHAARSLIGCVTTEKAVDSAEAVEVFSGQLSCRQARFYEEISSGPNSDDLVWASHECFGKTAKFEKTLRSLKTIRRTLKREIFSGEHLDKTPTPKFEAILGAMIWLHGNDRWHSEVYTPPSCVELVCGRPLSASVELADVGLTFLPNPQRMHRRRDFQLPYEKIIRVNANILGSIGSIFHKEK